LAKTILIALLALAAMPSGASFGPPLADFASPPDSATIERFRELVDEGTAQMSRRDPERAAALFRELEALVPSSAEGPYLLAGALAQMGQKEEATKALARAILSGLSDHRRLEFDGALVPLRDDPRFRAMVEHALLKSERLMESRAAGAPPAALPEFETLDELRRHYDRVQRDSVRWRSVQTPGEYERLRWSTIDARRGALDLFATQNRGKREGAEAELEALVLLADYRDPIGGWELEVALRRLGEFVARGPASGLQPRAQWMKLHLRRKSISSALAPRERNAAVDALAAELESFVSDAKEKGWPEGGLALLDLAALQHGHRRGDPGATLARMREEYAGVELVWSYAREEEAALLLRVLGVPEFEAEDLAGRDRGRARLLGQVVLLDFWATWCGPCLDQAPDLARLHRQLAREGKFLLLGVSIDAEEEIDAEQFAAFLTEQGMVWPQVRDGLGDESPLVRAFGLEAVPFQVLMAPDGSVIEAGPRVDEETIRAALAELDQAGQD
jgi:thiol-disulfide isomerase/thioredoxin